MKKIIIASLLIFLAITEKTSIAQETSIDGAWTSTTGNRFQLESVRNGFVYKNLLSGDIISAYYIGDNPYGNAMYRADFGGLFPFFMLYTVNSTSEIICVDSRNPYQMMTWTKKETQYETNDANAIAYRQYQNNQKSVIDLIPGASYLAKKRYLDGQKDLAKSRLKTAENNYQNAPTSSQTTYQFEIDRLNREINDIDMKLLDLEQMKLRGEIR